MERNGDYTEKWSHCVHFVFNKLRDKKYLIFKVFIWLTYVHTLHVLLHAYISGSCVFGTLVTWYRGVDKSLPQPTSLSIAFFQSREQVVVRLDQIQRIGWLIKTMETQVGQFLLDCKSLVSRFRPGRAKDLSAPLYMSELGMKREGVTMIRWQKIRMIFFNLTNLSWY
jgi:hypothetical protein